MTSPSNNKQLVDQEIPKNGPANTPPPPYASTIAGGNAPPLPAFKTKPTSFFGLDENKTIRGEFGVDPSVRIPPSILPPLQKGETEYNRKNLSLVSGDRVHADIWLLPGENAVGRNAPSRRTSITLTAFDSIHARVRTLDGAAPFALTTTARYGTMYLALPRSFQGLLLLKTHGRISLSKALVQNATQLTTHRYFVGDLEELGDKSRSSGKDWASVAGQEIRVEYVDEAEAQAKGWLSRLFWRWSRRIRQWNELAS